MRQQRNQNPCAPCFRQNHGQAGKIFRHNHITQPHRREQVHLHSKSVRAENVVQAGEYPDQRVRDGCRQKIGSELWANVVRARITMKIRGMSEPDQLSAVAAKH